MHWHGNWRHADQAIHMKNNAEYCLNEWKHRGRGRWKESVYLRVSERMLSCMRVNASFFLFKRSRRNEWNIWVSKTCKHTRVSLVQERELSVELDMSIYLPFCKRCDLSSLWTGGTPRCWKHDAHSSGTHKLHYRKQRKESRCISDQPQSMKQHHCVQIQAGETAGCFC